MTISIILAALVANFVTEKTKPNKPFALSAVEEDRRRLYIRGINALLSLVVLLLSNWMLGETIETAQITSLVELIFGAIAAFLASQGSYLLKKQ